MMKKVFTIALVIIVGGLFHGCELDTGQNFYFTPLEITNVDMPEAFVLGQTHNIDISFSRPDSCTFFEGFDVDVATNETVTVVAIGNVLTDKECTVTPDESLTAKLPITTQNISSYKLRFYTGENEQGNPQYQVYEVPVIVEN